ncbi:hypothetical protein NDU88_001548 [Pleurodeles waltl]|uniref:Uncharacterized protein n=1 Tax=Pleurodeles waltl TaxID=8319 RepID=A0AAV7SZJ6_PLEWA|nr:hypothetical protein NDU88_001548 [Pleurodeles waltl]
MWCSQVAPAVRCSPPVCASLHQLRAVFHEVCLSVCTPCMSSSDPAPRWEALRPLLSRHGWRLVSCCQRCQSNRHLPRLLLPNTPPGQLPSHHESAASQFEKSVVQLCFVVTWVSVHVVLLLVVNRVPARAPNLPGLCVMLRHIDFDLDLGEQTLL